MKNLLHKKILTGNERKALAINEETKNSKVIVLEEFHRQVFVLSLENTIEVTHI